MSQILLSVIVPVFRVEKYLDRCIMSLLHQDLSADEYEIILVDDGSDDTCPQKCDEYAAKHKQIVVIHQPNKGLSGARNTGIKAARGKYICFADSDDFVEPDCFGTLIRKAENESLDLLQFGLQIVYSKRTLPIIINTSDDLYSGEEFLRKAMSERCSCWIYLVRKELLVTTQTYFTEGINYEDIDWTPRMILHAKRIKRVSTIVYNYVQHEGSITHPKNKTGWEKVVENNMIVLQRLQQTSQKASSSKIWFQSMSSSIVCSILTIVAKYLYNDRKKYINQVLTIYPASLQSTPSFSTFERIKITIARLSPQLYCFLRHYL